VIQAILFDLNGTLNQSERLKAQSYAIAVQRLRGLSEPYPRGLFVALLFWYTYGRDAEKRQALRRAGELARERGG